MQIHNRILRFLHLSKDSQPIEAVASHFGIPEEQATVAVTELEKSGHVISEQVEKPSWHSRYALSEAGIEHVSNDDGTDAFLDLALDCGIQNEISEESSNESTTQDADESTTDTPTSDIGNGGEFGGGGAGGDFDPPESESSDASSSDGDSGSLDIYSD